MRICFILLIVCLSTTLLFASDLPSDNNVRGTALIERAPEITKFANGTSACIFADGRRLFVSPKAEINFTHRDTAQKDTTTSGPEITSLEQVGPGVWVVYKGKRADDGTILVDHIAFRPDIASASELKLRKRNHLDITEPNYDTNTAGRVVTSDRHEFEIIPNRTLQSEISRIGNAVVPAYIKALPDSDPNKIHFRFYVVNGLKTWSTGFPDGVVLVSAAIFSRLATEAQLAADIAEDVAAITQKHLHRMVNYNEWNKGLFIGSVAATAFPPVGVPLSLANLTGQGIASKHFHALVEQSGRLAVEYAVNAGYDPREVVAAFRTLAIKGSTKPKPSRAERDVYEHAADAADGAIDENYRQLDVRKFKIGVSEFQALAALVLKPPHK